VPDFSSHAFEAGRVPLAAWRRLRRFARHAGAVQLRVFLYAIYYLSVVPLAWLAKTSVRKTLEGSGGAWVDVAPQDDSIETLGRQH
jgi:hypothetical protein